MSKSVWFLLLLFVCVEVQFGVGFPYLVIIHDTIVCMFSSCCRTFRGRVCAPQDFSK